MLFPAGQTGGKPATRACAGKPYNVMVRVRLAMQQYTQWGKAHMVYLAHTCLGTCIICMLPQTHVGLQTCRVLCQQDNQAQSSGQLSCGTCPVVPPDARC
jgi:hypothetical protein